MFLLLHLELSAVLECPLDNIGLIRCALDELALLEAGPELAEVLELDQVPDIAEWRLDDGRLVDRGGGGNAGGHGGDLVRVQLMWLEIGGLVWWIQREISEKWGF